MKTIKTEIHNKPITATHYRDECNEYEFSWVKFNNNSMFVWDDTYWNEVEDDNFEFSVKPIKTAVLETQMNIDNLATQTPEEKEALDSIALRQLSKFSGKAEWKNGDDVEAYGKPYKYVGLDPFNDNLCICLANQDDDPQCFSVDEIKKPESPQQRKERERLEAAEDIYYAYMSQWEICQSWSVLDQKNKDAFLAIVDKTNYRKESK